MRGKLAHRLCQHLDQTADVIDRAKATAGHVAWLDRYAMAAERLEDLKPLEPERNLVDDVAAYCVRLQVILPALPGASL